MPDSFLWYDLETFGRSPRDSRIAQFAAIRTDPELNPVDGPVSLYCRPSPDFLPEPEAALVTGISPQHAAEHGLPEAECIGRIHALMSRPGTCALGYNSIRFDDEFIRYGLYRNFFDPYEREYAGGNSRWDLLDVMRMAHAMQPDALHWPLREDGQASFKLEHLAEANGCSSGSAHEALTDVRNLLCLARKLKAAMPGLWQFALGLRDKQQVADRLQGHYRERILHVSGQFPASQACTALLLPLMPHPNIKTRTLAVQLRPEALKLIDYSEAQIEHNLFSKASERGADDVRIGVKEIHHNRCPIVFTPGDARALGLKPDLPRFGIDLAEAQAVQSQLQAHAGAINRKLTAVFGRTGDFDGSDPDGALYDGFIDRADKRKFGTARASRGQADLVFNDARLSELYFRYKARNWPETLNGAESAQWLAFRQSRLSAGKVADYMAHCDALAAQFPEHTNLLAALKQWAGEISGHTGDAGAIGVD